MSVRKKLNRGGITLILGQVMSQGLAALRNILIARMILTEKDYGIAQPMIMIVALIETLSNLGSNLLVIQHADGDDLHFLSVVHSVSTFRSVVSGMVIVAISYPAACLFGNQQAAWGYALLALVPVLKGLTHHDLYRFQRHFAYGPITIQEVLSQVLTIAAWFVLNWWRRDYASVVYLLILQAAISTILSHVIAQYPYRWSRDLAKVRYVLELGLPSMYNGISLFLVYQSERLIISSASRFFPAAQYDMEDVASFSAAMQIASMASMFLTRVTTALFMPLLSRMDEHFLHRYRLTIQASAVIAGLATIPLILFSGPIVQVVYRGRYSAAAAIISFAACGQAFLTLRTAGHAGLLAQGLFWDCFYNNLWRSIAIPLVILLAAFGFPVAFIAYPAMLAEVIALIASASTIHRRFGIAHHDILSPIAYLVCGLGSAYFLGFYCNFFQQTFYWSLAISLWVGFGFTGIFIFPHLFAEVFRSARSLNYRSA